ncbi:hypothetical protein HK102_003578, partial [Quaeritorhiza haematococci]
MDRIRKSRSSSVDPTNTTGLNEEQSLWSQMCQDLFSLDESRQGNDTCVAKVNRIHGKLAVKLKEGKEAVSAKAANKMLDMYKEAVDQATAEQKYAYLSSSIINTALERLSILMALRDATENGYDSTKRKKRKLEEKTKGGAASTSGSTGSTTSNGPQLKKAKT